MNANGLSIKRVQSFRDKIRFANAEHQIQKKNAAFVPHLVPELLKTLNQKKNPFFSHAEAQYFLAFRAGQIVGRIAAVWDYSHQAAHQDQAGFFGYFEAENRQETAHALLQQASQWLKAKGAQRLRGPINLSLNNECGLLVHGFDLLPAIMMPYNPPYYINLLESFGLQPLKELYSYKVEAATTPLDRLRRLTARIQSQHNIQLRLLDLKNIHQEAQIIRQIYNAAWANNWGFIPATENEFRHLAKGLRRIVHPQLAFIAEIEGTPVGFSITVVDVNQAIKKINGKLLPFGIFRLPFLMKQINIMRLPILGVLPQHRKKGIESLCILESVARGKELGVEYGDCSWVLEENYLMRNAMEKLGATPYKRHRLYEMLI